MYLKYFYLFTIVLFIAKPYDKRTNPIVTMTYLKSYSAMLCSIIFTFSHIDAIEIWGWVKKISVEISAEVL